MSPSERLMADYAGTSLTIGPHPLALRRAELALRGVLRASDLPHGRHGRRVRVAGAVITRQRPGTAKGFVFLTLEDETGIANIIVRPGSVHRAAARDRRGALSARRGNAADPGRGHVDQGRACHRPFGRRPRAAVARFPLSYRLPAQSGSQVELLARSIAQSESLENRLLRRQKDASAPAGVTGARRMVPVHHGRAAPRLVCQADQIDVARAPLAWRRWPSCGFAPSRIAICICGVGGKRAGARSGRTLHRHRNQAIGLQQRIHGEGRSRPRVERQVSARSADRGRRVAHSLGHRLSPAADLLPAEWNARKATSPNPQLPARFREKKPDLHGLDAEVPGPYYQNPFVGTREMNGLLVLQAMLGNSDLKDEQNVDLQAEASRSRARSNGTSRAISARRSAAPACSTRRAATRRVRADAVHHRRRRRQGAVRLSRPPPRALREHHAGRRALDLHATSALTDAQWHDAFRAGGFPSPSPIDSSAG